MRLSNDQDHEDEQDRKINLLIEMFDNVYKTQGHLLECVNKLLSVVTEHEKILNGDS